MAEELVAGGYCASNPATFPCNLTAFNAAFIGAIASLAGGIMVVCLNMRIKKSPRGNDLMNKISDQISVGAKAFLTTEYKYLTVYMLIVATILFLLYFLDPPSGHWADGLRYSLCFLAGGFLSASAGWRGMATATDANVRTTEAADKQGLAMALFVAVTGGSVMGFTVVVFGLLGISLSYYLSSLGYDDATVSEIDKLIYAADAVAAFGFGASSIALFARVAGGIYTKAADIGADLVGKVEMDIPEDDPRNPAVIADNVGDNVGDVAGMGADLFESYVGGIIAAVTLANGDIALIMLPFYVAGAGIISAVVGYFAMGVNDDANQKDLLWALTKGNLVSSVLVIGITAAVVAQLFEGREEDGWKILGCIILGLVSGASIGKVTEYFTSYEYAPTQSITNAAATGPASVIIQGLGIGMISCVFPVLILVTTTLICNALSGGYGVAISGVGMLSTLGVTLAADAFGPIADNAGGIAEMAGMEERVRATTDAIDALGNTTAATGKGFAIGSAVLTALSLLTAFTTKADIGDVHIGEPVVLSGVIIGAMLPFLFAALTMLSVQKAAAAIIIEVRRQFKEIPGLREGTAEADFQKVIEISTKSSVEEMFLPGVYAIFSPLTIGFLIGPRCLTGLLGGSIATGCMMALMMANAGGAWDNAKKYIEIEGAHGGKGTEIHRATVVGDTVGDPFKDTSGPSLNILIKLMSIISLTMAPMVKGQEDWHEWWWGMIPLSIMLLSTAVAYHFLWKKAPSYANDLELTTEKLDEADAAIA
ncbi:energized vacuolar membrane proton pump [Seminavis robusta]|uniref:H(+)-exporting diphosphatase n=1 Tax=Seminavis robusta TaxID=568900 RepID=A0A9N8DKR6_9STRA|nr:energized vacuolar membrane proton pump [Seminavis robusta]|eukprot:Sro196_g083540.1 energized vacuolar membrane proton pump (766) ;mRNA; f:52626-55426